MLLDDNTLGATRQEIDSKSHRIKESKGMTKLKSVEEERADCVARFKDVPVGAWVWCCHHMKLIEKLTEPASARIDYILREKSTNEVARRLFEFRPVIGELPSEFVETHEVFEKASEAFEKASEAYWKASEAYWKAREKASEKARETLRYLHAAEVPGTTWDGQTIFGAFNFNQGRF